VIAKTAAPSNPFTPSAKPINAGKPASPENKEETTKILQSTIAARNVPETPARAKPSQIKPQPKTRKTHKPVKPVPKAAMGQKGRGLRKKGKTKAGKTQGVRYSGAGLSNPRPPYPASARERGQQGRVVLHVRVGANGRALSVRVVRSSRYPVLDRAAQNAVRRWRFRPAMKNGKSVTATAMVPISFRLRN
jgi:protein TonB